jgi:KDO2-lipid IV(A) lauroyltransferase
MSSRHSQFLTRLGSIVFSAAERYVSNKNSALQAEQAGARLARLVSSTIIVRKQRLRALSNLAMAYPEWSEARRKEITTNVFRHFAIVTADFLYSPKRTNEELMACEVEGEEFIDEALAMGKGTLFVTGHFGNWELLGRWVRCRCGNLTVVARDANDADMQRRVARIREIAGVEAISRGTSARNLLRKLQNNEVLGILPDQNSGESFLPFFGKPCGTVLGPAKLQIKTGAPILPAFCARIGPAQYKIEFKPLVAGSAGEDAESVMTRVNTVLEGAIREHPEQWLWLHDRWKSARQRGLL